MATYKLHLKSAGPNMITVIRVVQEITGLRLKAAKDLVNSAPCVIKEGYTDRSTADADMKKLTDEGAEAYVETIGIEAVSGYTFSINLIDSYTQYHYEYPVPYATVKLYTGENGQFITSGKTDAEGRFTYSVISSDSGYKGAPSYAVIEKLRFTTIKELYTWKTISTSTTINKYVLSTYQYLNIYMTPKGVIYFKPKYYDKSDFTYKDYTDTIDFSIHDAITNDDFASDFTIPSLINPDEDGYYYPAVSDYDDYTSLLYDYIDNGMVYFKLQCKRLLQLQSDDIAVIYFYPYNIFNSTGATDYTIQKQLTFYPNQKKLPMADIKQCCVSDYTHSISGKPSTFCPCTSLIRQNYYQNTVYYNEQLPSTTWLRPYNVATFKIVLCVYENETYMYNSNTPTQYGGATVTVRDKGLMNTYHSISAVTSTYTSLTTPSIYYTSKIKITLSDISAGLTFEKEKEEFYFIPGITEIRFNAYKHAASNPLRTIYVRPESASYNGKSSAKLICFCREGNFTHNVTLTCKWKTLNSTTTQSFTFTVSSGYDTFSYTLQPSADLDYGDQNWSMSFANPSQALNGGYSKDIEIDKGMISLSCKTKEQVDGETTVEVNVNIPPVTDIDLLFTNERGSESYETFNARNYTQQYFLPFDGTISMSTTAPSDAFYDYDY